MKDYKDIELALVLGGGGSRGLAHLGVLNVLADKGIKPDLIVGTSAGAMVGALYAHHQDAGIVRRELLAAEKKHLMDKTWRIHWGMSQGRGLRRFMNTQMHDADFSDLSIPFVAVALDIDTGDLVPISDGNVAHAVQASCALPPIFHPVKHNGRVLVDGGAVAPVPVAVAKQFNPKKIIAVNVGIELPAKKPRHCLGVYWRYSLMRIRTMDRLTSGQADVVIRPYIPGNAIFDDSDKAAYVAAGELAAREALQGISV